MVTDMNDKPFPIIEECDIKSVIEELESIPKNELAYEKILLLSKCYYQLITKDYDGSYPLREHEQEKLIHAARLLKTVEKQGYDDYRWCGLLGSVLQYVDCCDTIAFQYMERSLRLSKDFPQELLDFSDDNYEI